jgi:hypothetical protein
MGTTLKEVRQRASWLQRKSAREMRRWRCRNTRLNSLRFASNRAASSTAFGKVAQRGAPAESIGRHPRL